MIEELVFNLLAVSLFIIIFFKILRKNDSNYVSILLLEAIGICISFIEIKLGIEANLAFTIIKYVFAIVIPIVIIIIELYGINFSEIFSCIAAKFCLFIGDKKTAKAILLKLCDKYKDSYLGHKLLAEIYEKEGGMRRAIDEYVEAIDQRPNDTKSYFKIAALLKELGKKDEAIQMLETLLKNSPDEYEASIMLGELLCEQERYKEAINVYQDALKFRPLDFDLYYNLGIVYTMLSDFQMAKEMYEKAAEINHRLHGAHYNLGLIALMQKELDAAEKYFEECMYGELEPMAYYQMAKIYMLKGEKDKAITFLNKAIELEPKLLYKANKEKIFGPIKSYITVSVKVEEKEKDEKSEEVETEKYFTDGEKEEDEDLEPLEIQEKKAREYLEEASSLVENMVENNNKKHIEDRLNEIFEREKRKEEEEIEKEEKLEREKEEIKHILAEEIKKEEIIKEKEKQKGEREQKQRL